MSKQRLLSSAIPLAVLAAVTLYLPYLLDGYTVHVANVAMIFCLLAIGLFLSMGISGQIDLAQVAFLGIGAYTAGVLTTQAGWGFWPAALAGVVLTVVASLLVGIPALRLQSHYLAIVTLGLALAFVSLVLNLPIAGQGSGLSGIPAPTFLGIDLSSDYLFYYLEWIALAAGIAFAAYLVRTRLGRRLRAMRDDSLAASAMGAQVPALRMVAFAFGGLYGGVAGVLYAGMIRYVAPDSFGLADMFFLLAMVVIGGRRSLPGVLVGAVGLIFVRELLSNFSVYAQLGYGILVVLIVVFAPTGLAGIPSRAIRLWRHRRGTPDEARRLRPYRPAGSAAKAEGPGPDAPIALEATEVVKSFKGLRALDGVSLSVRQGEIRGIVGPNGSGKTTFFNVLSGVHPPTSGAISVFGRRTTSAPSYALSLSGLARTFQNLRLFSLLTVRENIMVGLDRTTTGWSWRYLLWPFGVARAERAMQHAADELLERYGLAELADTLPGELSYGAQRRVEIARAMGTRPRLLLLDEPAAGLNGEEMNQLKAIVQDIRAQGVTVLLIEHNMGLVMSLCDRVTVLATGKVVADGLPREVARTPAVIEAYLGDDAVLDQEILNAKGADAEVQPQ